MPSSFFEKRAIVPVSVTPSANKARCDYKPARQLLGVMALREQGGVVIAFLIHCLIDNIVF
jgi:hypothetical protein